MAPHTPMESTRSLSSTIGGDIGGLDRGVAQDCQAGRGGILLLLLGLLGIALLVRLGRLGHGDIWLEGGGTEPALWARDRQS